MKLKEIRESMAQLNLYLPIVFLIGIAVYYTIIWLGIPEILNRFFWPSSDLTLFSIITFIALYFAYLPKGWLGLLTSFTGTLALFAGQLAALWTILVSSYSSSYVFSGLFPSNDANFYYESSLNLLAGKTFNPAASWRPLSHGVLATLLGITQENLQLTITILVLLVAISCFFLAREIQSSHGTASSVLVLLLTFVFIKPFIGTLGTENLGIAFGAVALAMLWRGLINKQITWCLGGIFMLTLGLNIRAGVFFILPALVIWGTWAFPHHSRLSFKFFLGGFSLIFLGFFINSLIFKLVASPDTEPNANFSLVLYGMVVGGDWTSMRQHHPDIVDKHLLRRLAYRLALEAIWDNPWVLVRGFWRACQAFFKDGFLFSFMRSSHSLMLLSIFSCASFVNFYRQRKTLIPSFMLSVLMGILLSLPFVPPWDAGIRVYATTIPFLALFPALGLAFLLTRFPTLYSTAVKPYQGTSPLFVIFSVLLIFLLTMGTIMTKFLSVEPQFVEISCPRDTEVVYFRNSQGSSFNLVADDAIEKTYLPNLRMSDFKQFIIPPNLDSPELINGGFDFFFNVLDSLPVGTKIINKVALNYPHPNSTKPRIEGGDGVWIMADKNLFPQTRGVVGSCGKYLPFPQDKGFLSKLFLADSMKLVSP